LRWREKKQEQIDIQREEARKDSDAERRSKNILRCRDKKQAQIEMQR
jgi:hypothetical protein